MVYDLFVQWSTGLMLLDRRPIPTGGDLGRGDRGVGGVSPYLISLCLRCFSKCIPRFVFKMRKRAIPTKYKVNS